MPRELTDALRAYASRADAVLERALPGEDEAPEALHRAMRYSVLGGGKRIRPMLVYAACMATGGTLEAADACAAAVEIVHAYSLIHDDLPAMDDDALRRGRPTCHVAFGEATAILAGDALQALAFELVAGDAAVRAGDAARVAMLARLASVALGALASARATPAACDALERYGHCVGLAFQIRDDVLDVEGATDAIGKQQGADAARGKPTYPAILGLAESRRLAGVLRDEAHASLARAGLDHAPLRDLADYAIEREA